MRKYFLGAMLFSLIFGHFGSAISQARMDALEWNQYVPGEILVKFKKTTPRSDIIQLNATLGLKTIKEFPSMGVYHIKLKPGETVAEAIKKYSGDPNVEYAEPNFIVHALATFPNDPPFDPGDPNFGVLWGLHNTGQTVNGTAGTSDADIDAPEAWDITTGDSNVVIAVIDSGVAWDHPELAGNMWTNAGETPGNGIDDDGNGYVDDIRGWDFIDNDNDPMDFYCHGTHVAGTIAGVGNNIRGIAGVMWTARIMPLRFLDATGFGDTADAISAIDYAITNGARVLNNSWGGYGFSQALKDAIERSNSVGAVFVAAAGNDGLDNDSTPTYPASFDVANIISVAATDQNDSLASFSNYGATTVDVGAPGVNTYSTVPARQVVFSDNFDDGTMAPWTAGGTPNTWAVTTESPPTPPSGTYTLADSPGGDYAVGTNNWAFSPSVDLSGRTGCALTYQIELDVEYLLDFLFIEASTDGINWTNIYGPGIGYTGSTGGAFFQLRDDISSYDGQPTVSVRFRLFESNGSGVGNGTHIDDFQVTSCSSDYSADTQYDYFEGTSMASPHVSGLAGLIMAAFPTISNTAVKSRILNGTDFKASLAVITVTGGRINAYNSLMIPVPPGNLTAIAMSSSQIDLSWVDNSSNEDEFTVERSVDFGATYNPIATVAGTGGTGSTIVYNDTGVSAGQFYYYRVSAKNTYGDSAYSNEAMSLTPGGNFGKTGGSAGGPCFIATAAYGSRHGDYIDFLRAFRDRYLMGHSIGKKWVTLYYRYSPPVAGFIADHPEMRKGIRLTLFPFVAFSAGMTQTTTLQKGFILCLIVGFLLGMALLFTRRKAKRWVSLVDPS